MTTSVDICIAVSYTNGVKKTQTDNQTSKKANEKPKKHTNIPSNKQSIKQTNNQSSTPSIKSNNQQRKKTNEPEEETLY